MSIHQKRIQSLTGDDGELVLQFFVAFSRFEYALKRAGFVKNSAYDTALPDWQKFAKKRFVAQLASISDIEFTEAKSYMLQNPPRKQTFVKLDKRMMWQNNTKRSGEGEAEYLLRLVRDVRNNLFHGGKYPEEPVSDESLRNGKLLQACLTILEKCLSLNTDVNGFFEEVE